jgi:CRP/FNR family cyclic AMP-dependent transcriptional regulator
MTWRPLLEKTELVSGLTAAEIELLYELFEQRSFRGGAVVFEEESRGRELFFVCDGRVEIVMRGLREDDNRMVVNEVKPGQCFGEMALVDGAPRSAQARAKEDCVLLMLREANFRVLADKHARVGYVVMRNLASTVASRLRTTNLRLRNNHDWVSILGNADLPSR